jgi:hypothetical protein
MKKIQSILFVLILIVSTTSCNKDENKVISTPTTASGNLNLGASISRDFIGQILDESNNPIAGANVKIAGITKLTDVNGIFIIKNAGVNEQMAYVTATKTGFLDGSRSLVPTTGMNNVKIILYSSNITQTINSGTASTVTLPNGTKVTFDGNFRTDTGVAYSGAVSVILKHLDINDANYGLKMPGMLLAQNTSGAVKVLETYGMINVVLKGAAGQNLQIVNPSAIEMPIPLNQQTIAPTSIPLWHFDETLGYWKEDGQATRMGNLYKGTVTHFSWWNCDVAQSRGFLHIKVTDSSGNPIPNIRVDLIPTGYGFAVTDWTNATGQIYGVVPSTISFTINVYSNCGLAYTATIPAISDNSTVIFPNIVLNSSATSTITTLQGNLLKCDGTNVVNGYLLTGIGRFLPINNGVFSYLTTYCNSSNSFTIKGYDLDNLQTTGTLNYFYSSPITNLGNISTCNAANEYISYKIDNGNTTYLTDNFMTASFVANFGYDIQASNNLIPSEYAKINCPTTIPGSYTTAIPAGDLIGFQYVNEILGINISDVTTNNVVFKLNSFGAVGQYIDMTVIGSYNDVNGFPHTINATVHVIRDN